MVTGPHGLQSSHSCLTDSRDQFPPAESRNGGGSPQLLTHFPERQPNLFTGINNDYAQVCGHFYSAKSVEMLWSLFGA